MQATSNYKTTCGICPYQYSPSLPYPSLSLTSLPYQCWENTLWTFKQTSDSIEKGRGDQKWFGSFTLHPRMYFSYLYYGLFIVCELQVITNKRLVTSTLINTLPPSLIPPYPPSIINVEGILYGLSNKQVTKSAWHCPSNLRSHTYVLLL